jgi:hypothetical protein
MPAGCLVPWDGRLVAGLCRCCSCQHPTAESSLSCAASETLGCWLCQQVLEFAGLPFHGTRAGVGAPGKTAYLILIGLNIEICFMFAVAGIAFGKMLPPDKRARI